MALDSPATEEKQEEKKVGAFRAPQENFTRNHFIYGKLLGLGSYSKVVRVKKKDTGQEYALKVMDKRHIMRENKVQYVKMERLILDQLDHPGVTRLHFTFQDNLYLYMGMECCQGGELFDQIRRKGKLSTKETCFYAAEIVDALEYIHSEGLIHRDLKPENILFTADGHLKIADFGSSKMLRSFTNGIITCEPDEKSCTFVGTAEYVAPEVLNSQPITPRVDMWALGCIIFQMLDGRPPFKAASEYLTFQKVMSRDFAMPQNFPPDAKDLVDKLLNLAPEKRPDFVAIKKHPFFTGVDWSNLWKMPAPMLALPSGQTGDDWDLGHLQADLEAFELSESSSESGSASNSQSSSPKNNASGEFSTSPSQRRRSSSPSGGAPSGVCTGNHTLTEDCTLEQWQRFLTPGERLLGTSMVRKYSGMGTKRQQLLLTNKPRLAIVDLKKLILRREIRWSNNPNELYVEVEDQLRFSIRTPNLTWHFEDLRGLAHGWRGAIEKLQNEQLHKPQVEQLFEKVSSKTHAEPGELRQSLVHMDETTLPQANLDTNLKPENLLANIEVDLHSTEKAPELQNIEPDLIQVEVQELSPEDTEDTDEFGEASKHTLHIAQRDVNATKSQEILVDKQESVNNHKESLEVLADQEKTAVSLNGFQVPLFNKEKSVDKGDESQAGLVDKDNLADKQKDWPAHTKEQILGQVKQTVELQAVMADQMDIQNVKLQTLPLETPDKLAKMQPILVHVPLDPAVVQEVLASACTHVETTTLPQQ